MGKCANFSSFIYLHNKVFLVFFLNNCSIIQTFPVNLRGKFLLFRALCSKCNLLNMNKKVLEIKAVINGRD